MAHPVKSTGNTCPFTFQQKRVNKQSFFLNVKLVVVDCEIREEGLLLSIMRHAQRGWPFTEYHTLIESMIYYCGKFTAKFL